MTPDTPLLGAAQGADRFHPERLHRVVGATPACSAATLAFEGGSQADGTQRFTGQGTATAEACAAPPSSARWRAWPLERPGRLPRDARRSSRGQPQFSVTSNLVGLGVDLPRRSARRRRRRSRCASRTGPTTARRAGSGARQRCGSSSAACCRRGSCARARATRRTWLAARSGVAEPAAATPAEAPEPLVLPATGVTAIVALRKANVDEWEAAADRLFAEPARGTAPPQMFDAGGGSGYVPDHARLRIGELHDRLAPARQRHRRPVARGRPVARQCRCRPARRLHRVPTGAPRRRTRRAGRGTGLRAAVAPDPAQGRGRARREPARRAAGQRAGARHRGRRLRAARQAPRPARDRGGEPLDRRSRRGPRMAAVQVQPDHAGGAAGGHRHLGRRRGPGARGPARRRWTSSLDARRQRRPARAPRHGQGRARRQGHARRPACPGPARRSRSTTPKHGRADQGRDRRRPVPQGRARARRGCSACSACSRCRAGCCSTSATCSRRASPSTPSPATSRSRTAWPAPTTCACAACRRRC